VVATPSSRSNLARWWAERALRFVYSFHLAVYNAKVAHVLTPYRPKEFRDAAFTRMVTSFLLGRLNDYTQCNTHVSLSSDIGIVVAEIARPENLFENSGIAVALEVASRELVYENIGLTQDEEKWHREMIAVDPSNRASATKYQKVIDNFWTFMPTDCDPYVEVMSFAETECSPKRIDRTRKQLEQFLRRTLKRPTQ
jgi:hypothetical protein